VRASKAAVRLPQLMYPHGEVNDEQRGLLSVAIEGRHRSNQLHLMAADTGLSCLRAS
jgi:hypothetical protein